MQGTGKASNNYEASGELGRNQGFSSSATFHLTTLQLLSTLYYTLVLLLGFSTSFDPISTYILMLWRESRIYMLYIYMLASNNSFAFYSVILLSPLKLHQLDACSWTVQLNVELLRAFYSMTQAE